MSPFGEHTISRRGLVTAAASAGVAGALGSFGLPAPVLAAQDAGQIKEVARNRTLIHGITGNQMTDYNMMNPFLPGIATSSGYPIANEALFYYNAYNTDTVCGPEDVECAGGIIPWLGESYEYNADFTAVTIKLRDGVTCRSRPTTSCSPSTCSRKMPPTSPTRSTWKTGSRRSSPPTT
jgi:ABC-type transport system substrate-binding protein